MKQSSLESNHSSHSPKKPHHKHSSSDSSSESQRSRSLKRKLHPTINEEKSTRNRRSRSRQKRHHRSDSRQHKDDKQHTPRNQSPDHFDLGNYEHLYFLEDEHSLVSAQNAIWTSVVNYGLRPKKILIICENEKKITRLLKTSSINRQMIVIDQDSKEQSFSHHTRDIKELVKTYDVILMTQEKSSITLGLNQDDIELFDLVINHGKTYSIEFYSLLPQFLGEHGIILTIFQEKKEMERHQRKLKIRFKVIDGQLQQNDIQKEIFNNLQFSKAFTKSSAFDDLGLLKTLPYSIEETSLRLFSLLKQAYKPKTSIHEKRQGHVTFCLKTDTQFNSIKYVWNFIREQMPPGVVKNIKDMKKFENQRGVVFNVPTTDLSKWETFQSKIHKNQKKYKGYKLYEFINRELPKLQDTESEEYKQLQQKKEEALKNRHKLQLFVGGIPYDVNEVEIRRFFGEKEVSLFMVRILRDSSGFSKGIAFGLAENDHHFEKAIKLNGQKFGDRQLRIKLADQKDK